MKNTVNIKKIRNKLEQTLDEERFEHTLGVAKTAAFLACLFDYDSDKAYLAGLLHDCAKNVSHKDKIKLCKKNNIDITEVEYENPSLLHAKCGAILANEQYDISDADILNAIRNHTTGRPDMSMLEKITFIADYIEPGRKAIPGLKEIRETALVDIDKCVYLILKNTLKYLSNTAKAIDPNTQMTLEFYEELIQ